jgi:hypothetical protein
MHFIAGAERVNGFYKTGEDKQAANQYADQVNHSFHK